MVSHVLYDHLVQDSEEYHHQNLQSKEEGYIISAACYQGGVKPKLFVKFQGIDCLGIDKVAHCEIQPNIFLVVGVDLGGCGIVQYI